MRKADATVTGYLTVVAMGLFTMVSIIGGYLLLNTAVTNIARESSYYTFVRLNDIFSDSMKSSSSTATNMHLSAKYVIFTAYFSDDSRIPYRQFEGQNFNDIAVNHNDMTLFNQVIQSSIGRSYLNAGISSREALSKCVDDLCVCFGEMNTFLTVHPDYLIPGACVNICWGENPSSYDACLTMNKNTPGINPRNLMKLCNQELAVVGNPMCKECVDYMNDYASKLSIASEQGYDVLMIRNITTLTSDNKDNTRMIEDFSEATKLSFITNVIECKPMSQTAIKGLRASYCDDDPYLLAYTMENKSMGLFGVLTPNQLLNTEFANNNLLFKLFKVDYFQDHIINPQSCYVINSFIVTEAESAS